MRLRDELDRRGLRVCGGTVFAGLHKGPDALKKAIDDFGREARLLTAVGARYLVQLPEQYTDMHTGAATEPGLVDEQQWKNLVTGTNELGQVMLEEYGVELVFHPHVDTHVDTQERVERFLADTDPRYVNLCLDTGHIAYRHGSNVEIVQRFPERITYVHLKQVDPVVRDRAVAEKLPLSEAVKLGVMLEPPYGLPAMPPLLQALASLDRDIFAVVEQDLYPVEPDVPLPIAARTAGDFVACGLGPARVAVPGRRREDGPMTLNLGVIGVGLIGQDHIRRITTVVSGARVAAVTDVDVSRASSVAGGLSDVRVHRTGQDLIADEGIDAVVVTSWVAPTRSTYWPAFRPASTSSAKSRWLPPVKPAKGSSTLRSRPACGWSWSVSCAVSTAATRP